MPGNFSNHPLQYTTIGGKNALAAIRADCDQDANGAYWLERCRKRTNQLAECSTPQQLAAFWAAVPSNYTARQTCDLLATAIMQGITRAIKTIED